MTIRMKLELPVAPDSASVARHALSGLGSVLGAELTESVQLLVSELVTNSIRHARLAPDDVIKVRVDVLPGAARVEVEDGGPGFDARPRLPRIDAYQASGWGLALVDRIASRWGCESRGARSAAWFELDRNAPPPGLKRPPRRPSRENGTADAGV